MDIFELIISLVLLILIFFISKHKLYLLAALIAEFPVFSFFTYSVSSKPHLTAIYLSIFSFIVSLSFLAVFLLGYFLPNKTAGLIIGFSVWLILSISTFLIIRTVRL